MTCKPRGRFTAGIKQLKVDALQEVRSFGAEMFLEVKKIKFFQDCFIFVLMNSINQK